MKTYIQSFLLKLLFFALAPYILISNTSIDGKKNHLFVENKGQYPANIKYVGFGSDANIIITNEAILYDFHSWSESGLKGHVLEMKFSESNGLSKLELVPNGSVRNYFLGNNQSNWKYGIQEFKEIYIKNVYDGIDTRLFFENGNPRYDFIVAPNANPNQIAINLVGQNDLSINDFNEVTITTSLGEVKHSKLFSFQSTNNIKQSVKCNFQIKDGNIKFNVGNYDKSNTLVIDPIVVASFIGGSSLDENRSVHSIGDTSYVVSGWTESSDLVVTPGAYQASYALNRDAFIAKYKITNGNLFLIATSYVGSAGKDEANALDIDFAGNIYIAGNTTSSDFPNINGLANAYKGLSDMFVAKLSPDLSQLLMSNVFGGASDDFLNCMIVDKNGAVLFAGQTSSSDYFTKASVQPSKKLGSDGFVTRLNENGKLIDFSSFLGGTNEDVVNAITLFPDGGIGLVGSTLSTDFTIFPNFVKTGMGAYSQKPYDDSQNGGWDAFVTKLSSDGASFDFSTFFGGSADDFGKGIVGYNDGSVIIAGESSKESQSKVSFPTSDSPFQKLNKGGKDIFVASLSKILINGKNQTQNMIFSTFVGGGADEELKGVTKNEVVGSIGLVGRTKSADFPKTLQPDQTPKYAGGYDGFFTEITSIGSDLIYSSLFGGNQDDVINGLSYDSEGDYYIAGSTQSTNMPILLSSQLNGASDGFSAKYVYGSLGISNPTPGGTYCNGTNIDIDWTSQDLSATGYTLELGRKSSSTLSLIASKVKTNPYSWKIPNNIDAANDYYIKISHQSGLVSSLNGTFQVSVPPIINSFVNENSSTFICEGEPIQLKVTATGNNLAYEWKKDGVLIPNQTSNVLKIDKTTIANKGNYIAVIKGGCLPDPQTNPIFIDICSTTKFQSQLVDTTFKPNTEFTITANANGCDLKFKWQKGKSDILGQTNSVLTLTKPANADEGKYRCIVIGKCSSDTTNEINLKAEVQGYVNYSNEKSDKIMFRYLNDDAITIQLGNLVDGNVRLSLFNTNGQLISSLINQNFYNGIISIELNTNNLSTGLYYLKLDNGNESSIKTLQVIK